MEALAEMLAAARLVCGEQHVLTHPTLLATYRSDGLRRNGPLPLAAILPASASEVASVVSACAAAGVRYVVRGAGTSDSGGALPVADGVLLVLTRMRRIVSLSARADRVTVEAGTPPQALRRCGRGRWLGDPTAIGTVGGHVAETAGIANVLAIELVRPDGSRVGLDSRGPGYDIAGAFPGSRGQAGIAVTITLGAVPQR